MITIDEAMAALDAAARPIDPELRALPDAAGLVLAADAHAACDLPPFTQSAMDGWAVRAADIVGGAMLSVGATIHAGRLDAVPRHAEGTATRIMTGAMVPDGADTVIPQEDAEQQGDSVRLPEAPAGANVRVQGEERARGERLLCAGTRLTPGRLGALSVAGIAQVSVRRRPRVCIVTTGDEVIAPGTALAPGQVYDGNQAMLKAWCAARGVELVRAEHVADDRRALRQAMERARTDADVLITTGGVSVGEHDHVVACSKEAGYDEVFWRIRQKPGKPTYVATAGDRVHLGLPGNPGAVWVGTQVYVARWLDLLEGSAPVAGVAARLGADLRQHPFVDRWIRVSLTTGVDGVRQAMPLAGQGSHMLGNLAACDGLMRLPRGDGAWDAGREVEVIEVAIG